MSEEVGVNRTTDSRECDICYNWYFRKINFKFQPKFYNGNHDLMQKVKTFNDVVIVSTKKKIIEFIFGI